MYSRYCWEMGRSRDWMVVSRKCSPDTIVEFFFDPWRHQNIYSSLFSCAPQMPCNSLFCYPTPFSSQVVEGEQVHRMRREREGLQRGKVQGAGLPICQGGELRHDVSGIPCVLSTTLFAVYISLHASVCTSQFVRCQHIIYSPLHTCTGDITPRRARIG
jgi:hypothetical protein